MAIEGGRAWTGEQLRAIERRDGDLLLDAGAGSGKTSVLVERVVRAVLEDGIDIASILTITFTDKAAAELRDRIRLRLREVGAVDAARATEGAFISTIHGFCARVLRVHALAAGLDPNFVVLDRPESNELAMKAFDDALPALAASSDGAVDLIAAYGAGPLRAAILAVFGQLRCAGELIPRLPPAPLWAGVDEARSELTRAASVVAAELGTVVAPGPQVTLGLERVQRCLQLAAKPDLWPGELDRARLPGGNGAALTTDACGDYRDALARFRAVCAARAAGPVRDLLDCLLTLFGSSYAARKRAVSGLDFEDLELLTRELLRTDLELRERYAQRLERIMVDEFQDTNRVQLELIESIARQNLFTVGDAQQSIYGFRHADVELFERRGEGLAAVGGRETLQTNFRSRPEILEVLNLTFADELGDRFKPLRAGRIEAMPAAEDPRVELLIVDKGADWDLEGLASPWRLAEARALADRVGELLDAGAAPGEVVVLTRATTDMRAYERALERRGLPTYVIGGRGYWSHPQVVDLVAYLRAVANPRDEESLYSVLASPLVGVSLDALVVLAAAARASGRDPWWVLRDPRGALDVVAPGDRERLSTFTSWFAAERAGSARSGIEDLIDSALERTGYDLAMLALPGGRRRLANVRKLMRLGREYESDHGQDLRGFLALVGEREAGRAGDSRESEAPIEGDGLDAVRLMTIHRAKGLEFEIVCVADLGRSPRRPGELLRVAPDGRVGIRLARAGVGGREPAWSFKEIGEEQQRAEESEERRLFYVAMTRARERLVLSGAAKLEGWIRGGGTGGGPIAWIAPALIPQLGERIAEGGGIVLRDGVSIGLRIADPAAAPPNPASIIAQPDAAFPDPSTPVAPSTLPPKPPPPLLPEPPLHAPAPLACTVPSLSYSTLGEYARCGYRFYAERVLGLPGIAEAPAPFSPAPFSPAPFSPAPSSPAPSPPSRLDLAAADLAAADLAAAEPALGRPATERGVLIHALLERLDFRRPVVPGPEDVAEVAARIGISPPDEVQSGELASILAGFGASELCARLGRGADPLREERFAFVLGSGVLVTGAIDVLAREPGNRALIVDYKSDRLQGADPAAVVRSSYETQRIVYGFAALRAGIEQVEIAHCFLERPLEPVTATYTRSDAPALEAELERLAAGVVRREFEVAQTPHRALCAGCPAEGGLCSWPLAMTRRESPDRLF